MSTNHKGSSFYSYAPQQGPAPTGSQNPTCAGQSAPGYGVQNSGPGYAEWGTPGYAGQNPGYAAGNPPAQPGSWSNGWFAFQDPGYLKGLALGAGIAYVLTNPKVQRALVKGAVTLWSAVQGGFEEVKEQVQDIKSEMSVKCDGSK